MRTARTTCRGWSMIFFCQPCRRRRERPAGRSRPARRPAELVEESVAAFPALAARIEVTGRTVAIQYDRQRAVQCLSNLIGNAGKYSDPESPIRLEYGPLEGEPWGWWM